MDLARDPRALLGDGPSELGEADRPPHADEQNAIGEQAQEVALGDVAAREQRGEHVVELGEEREGGAEAEPALEIVPTRAKAEAEADHRDQREMGLRSQRCDQQRWLLVAALTCERRQREADLVCRDPREGQDDRDRDEHLGQGPAAGAGAALRERGRGDQAGREEAAADPGPGLGAV